MGVPFATPADVAGRLNTTFDEGQEQQITLLLQDVSGLVRTKSTGLDDRIANGEVDSDLALAVTCQILIRVVAAVDHGGAAVVSETYPEYAYQLARSAAAGLAMTDDEIDLLSGVPPKRAFSVTPGGDTWTTNQPTPWCMW
jgi:hypothetical protein